MTKNNAIKRNKRKEKINIIESQRNVLEINFESGVSGPM
jgi:hypothetical protein